MRFYSLMAVFCMVGSFVSGQQLHDPKLEVVVSLDKSQPIGVSVSAENRVFVSFPKREPYAFGLAEVRNGKAEVFPNAAWNVKEGTDKAKFFVNVQDIYVDTDDQLWVLDSKPSPSQSIFGDGGGQARNGDFKLVQIDLATNTVVNQYDFEGLDKVKSALNDVRVDTDKQLAYLSDPGQAGLVVLDLKTRQSRLVLANTAFTQADPNIVLQYEGKEMRDGQGNPFRSNVNGIALTKDNRYFYFKPINSLHLYRIETKYLADAALADKSLQGYVEDLGETAITHGLVADREGNIYLTSSLDYSIKRLTPQGKIELVVQDSRLIWPDSLGVGSDGYLYFSCAQVNRLPQWHGGEDKTSFPYEIYRVKVL